MEQAWRAVTARTLAVDPLTVEGPIVMKSEENARHDARIVDGPLRSRRPGYVYQRLVDTRESGWITQSRPVIVGGDIVIAYEKWRRDPDLFFGTALSLPQPPSDLYSPDEQRQMLEFATRIGMDYGELDVLREKATGDLFVVDANRTPSWLITCTPEHEEAAYAPMADAFRDLLKRAV